MSNSYLTLEAFNNVFCSLAPSPIHGVGVFALKEIPKNIVIFSPIAWEKLDNFILKKLDDNILSTYKKTFKITNSGMNIPSKGYNSIDFRFYINHSYSPNLNYDSENDLIITKNIIPSNTELTINYKAYGFYIDNSFH